MREDGSPSGLRVALVAGRRELMLYVAAGAAYVALGVAFPELLFAWVVSAALLLVFVVVLPVFVRRLRQ